MQKYFTLFSFPPINKENYILCLIFVGKVICFLYLLKFDKESFIFFRTPFHCYAHTNPEGLFKPTSSTPSASRSSSTSSISKISPEMAKIQQRCLFSYLFLVSILCEYFKFIPAKFYYRDD